MTINDLIVNTARKYIGVTEIKQNQGWVEKDFQRRMEQVGWYPGMAWCMLYAELVWSEAYFEAGHSDVVVRVSQGFSAGVTETWNKVRRQKLFKVGNKPVKGAIAVWQQFNNGVADWRGHSGIVLSHNDSDFQSIEGNTNTKGSRDGDTVAIKKRGYSFLNTSGLVLQGFIYPEVVEIL